MRLLLPAVLLHHVLAVLLIHGFMSMTFIGSDASAVNTKNNK